MNVQVVDLQPSTTTIRSQISLHHFTQLINFQYNYLELILFWLSASEYAGFHDFIFGRHRNLKITTG